MCSAKDREIVNARVINAARHLRRGGPPSSACRGHDTR